MPVARRGTMPVVLAIAALVVALVAASQSRPLNSYTAPARPALEGVAIEAEAPLHLVTLALEVSRAEAEIGREPIRGVMLRRPCDTSPRGAGRLRRMPASLLESVPNQLPHCAHRQLLSQALASLVDNSLKYVGARFLRLSATVEQGRVRIEVADDGHGIAPENHARLFADYSRLDPAARRLAPGSRPNCGNSPEDAGGLWAEHY